MTPMVSWDGKENLQGLHNLIKLEKYLAGGLAFSSNQAAITACLELLGSRLRPISVIMPVNAPYDALMGVIRANARPVITDVDPISFQANVSQVIEALVDLPEAVVYLNRPGGLPVDKELLEAVQSVPTICDARVLPVEKDMLFTFNVYDISLLVGEGAVLYHKYEEQVTELKQIRADAKAELPEISSALAFNRLPQMSTYPDGSVYTQLIEKSEKSGIIGYNCSLPNPTYLIKVKDAQAVGQHFSKLGIQIGSGCLPVYKYPIARKRWTQEPNYPVAEALHKELVLLPNHENINKERLIEELWKI